MRRCVAVFDFDGTLTRCDTLPHFILFACGPWSLIPNPSYRKKRRHGMVAVF